MNNDSVLVQNNEQCDLATRALGIIEETEQAPVKTPVEQLEASVADFVKNAMAVTNEGAKLTRALEDSFVNDIESNNLSAKERITIYNIERSASNDRLFKIISPLIGMINERQRAEIDAKNRKDQAAQANVQVNVGNGGGGNPMDSQVASQVPPSVTIGLNNLFQLMAARAATKEVSE